MTRVTALHVTPHHQDYVALDQHALLLLELYLYRYDCDIPFLTSFLVHTYTPPDSFLERWNAAQIDCQCVHTECDVTLIGCT